MVVAFAWDGQTAAGPTFRRDSKTTQFRSEGDALHLVLCDRGDEVGILYRRVSVLAGVSKELLEYAQGETCICFCLQYAPVGELYAYYVDSAGVRIILYLIVVVYTDNSRPPLSLY